MLLEELFEAPIYGVPQPEKEAALLAVLNELDARHRANCAPYGAITRAEGKTGAAHSLSDLPFLPVRLFKSHLLESIPEEERFKMLTSSGTTGQQVSRISLDRATSAYQTKAMVKIMQEFVGKARVPMLVLDHPSVVKDRLNFSARGAGILGMSNFGRKHTYALDDETMQPNWDVIDPFLEQFGDGPVFLFGFTFMAWKYFVRALEEQGRTINIPQGVLVHSGGWKKLLDEAVDNPTFKARTTAATGIKRIHNFYGMVEQVGSIFVECEAGRLHAPSFADVIIRRAHDWSVADKGEEGLIQVLSCLPQSYPGHSLLTEDIGTLLGEDDCPCGRHGRTFAVHGRLPKAEVRGCSDTFDGQAA
ncbi:hypothetical protein [uncultured Sulfitobacter sp.]|uniref:LuxE/PaaK family acyltransferase n=1 Tax=uncultured Sulfitobacter sp. TaxID=191468 RepID=UPI002622B978|nr:hypothetical protein [uncultured Sulfitobacter sp.]